MRGGVHASPNYIATAVVLVVPIAGGVRVAVSIPIRVVPIPISIRIIISVVVIVVTESESESAAPEIATIKSPTTKFAQSTTPPPQTATITCHPAPPTPALQHP